MNVYIKFFIVLTTIFFMPVTICTMKFMQVSFYCNVLINDTLVAVHYPKKLTFINIIFAHSFYFFALILAKSLLHLFCQVSTRSPHKQSQDMKYHDLFLVSLFLESGFALLSSAHHLALCMFLVHVLAWWFGSVCLVCFCFVFFSIKASLTAAAFSDTWQYTSPSAWMQQVCEAGNRH